ncbi:MAG: hypothetical protein QFX37_03050 [Archaeoglobales archaeon]|nr:hypothetical protein [Archaeoglobales archaeon]
MGNLISANVDDFISFLKDFGVDILDYQKLESGGEGYTIIYVSNIGAEEKEILETCGFIEAGNDLWFIEGFEVEIDKLKQSEAFLNYFRDLEERKWRDVIEFRQRLDDIFYKYNKKTLFRTTHNTPAIALKWSRKGCEEELEGEVWKRLRGLRNTVIAHDSSKTEQIKRAREYLKELSGEEYPRKWHQFLSAQFRLIDDVLENLKSKIEGYDSGEV